MPCFLMTRTALGCRGFGWLPTLAASTDPAESRSSSASAICERALFPVQRNKTRGPRRERRIELGVPGRRRRQPQSRMERATHALEESAATSEIDAVVAVPSDRPSYDVWPPASPARNCRRWYDTRLCGSSSSSISSRTARSLCTSSCNSRHRTGCATSCRRNRGGSTLPRRGTTVCATPDRARTAVLQSNWIDVSPRLITPTASPSPRPSVRPAEACPRSPCAGAINAAS